MQDRVVPEASRTTASGRCRDGLDAVGADGLAQVSFLAVFCLVLYLTVT